MHTSKVSMLNLLPDETTTLYWPDGSKEKMAKPGNNIEMICELHNPLCLNTGQRFNICEDSRTVATGLVTQVMKD